MRNTGRTPWDVLGVAEDAPFDDVKRAYLRRARMTHPDATGGSAESFREVQAAFEALQRRPARSSGPAGPARSSGPAGPARSSGPAGPARTTPYDQWLSRPRPSQQWTDDDPPEAARTAAASTRRATFADLLASELGPRHTHAA